MGKTFCTERFCLKNNSFIQGLPLLYDQALFLHTVGDKKNGIFALFRCKMAFLKSKFEDDPVRVQRHNVPHFKDLEYIFKMRYSRSLNSHWMKKYQPSKLNVRKKLSFSTKTEIFFERSTLTAGIFSTSESSETYCTSF